MNATTLYAAVGWASCFHIRDLDYPNGEKTICGREVPDDARELLLTGSEGVWCSTCWRNYDGGVDDGQG